MTNLINNKVYIGKTYRKLAQRKCEHIYKMRCGLKKSHLHNALRKYGLENFLWEVLQDEILTEEVLNKLEKKYIQDYKTSGYALYNKREGGEGGKHSEETKIKISKAHKELNKIGFRHSTGTIAKMKQVKRTEKHKESIRKSNRTRNISKPFEVFDKDTGVKIGQWTNKAQCSRDLNVSLSAIDAGLKEKVKNPNKYIYKHLGGTLWQS